MSLSATNLRRTQAVSQNDRFPKTRGGVLGLARALPDVRGSYCTGSNKEVRPTIPQRLSSEIRTELLQPAALCLPHSEALRPGQGECGDEMPRPEVARATRFGGMWRESRWRDVKLSPQSLLPTDTKGTRTIRIIAPVQNTLLSLQRLLLVTPTHRASGQIPAHDLGSKILAEASAAITLHAWLSQPMRCGSLTVTNNTKRTLWMTASKHPERPFWVRLRFADCLAQRVR